MFGLASDKSDHLEIGYTPRGKQEDGMEMTRVHSEDFGPKEDESGPWAGWFILPLICLLIASIARPTQFYAAENKDKDGTMTMEELTVTSERIILPTRQTDETVYTGTEITSKGIQAQGAKAQTSVYESMDALPGVSVESADQSGLGAEQRSIRVRGVKGYFGALTVEGVPNYGGNPIGPRDYVYDMENFQSISVYKGAVPGDIGTGVGSRGGAIVLKPLWPTEDFGLKLSQSLGSDSFRRTFVRVDSGSLPPTGTRLSASYSYGQADKWKGPGDIGPRNNANIALVQEFGDMVETKLWLNHNDLDQDLYRALNISQAKDLSTFQDYAFNSHLTGNLDKDIYYYKYNRGSYENTDVLGLINVRPSDRLRLTLKPYLSREDSQIYEGVPALGQRQARVQKREREIDRTGNIAEVAWEQWGIQSVAGYLFEQSSMDISSQNYTITPSGLAYRGYGIMASPSGDSYVHSPYLKLSGSLGELDWQAGLKYFYYDEPSSKGYVTNPADYSLERASDLDREARSYDLLLPTLGIGYWASENIYIYASYGKNFIRPYAYMPIVGLYNTNRKAFQNIGVSLNDLFDGYDMEESDNFDLGFRFSTPWCEIAPTLFYAEHTNLLTPVYDPRVKLTYNQNVGEATSYGLDLESNFFLSDNLTLFINPTYTVMEYDKDITYQGQTLDSKGNQVIDTPEFMVRSGLIFNWKDLEIIPSVRYTSRRYGDIEHNERIDSFTVADLQANYTMNRFWRDRDLKLSLELNNIFDQEYISSITAMDYNVGGEPSYYAGAPFSAVLSASIDF
jgi:iron complex outermembrane receptor protein